MERPKVSRLIGRTPKCMVYIEDYVVTFLSGLKGGKPDEKCEVILFGEKATDAEGEFHIIIGAVKVKEDGSDDEHPDYARAREIFRKFSPIGYLNIKMWRTSELSYDGIMIGELNEGHAIVGYYTFYHFNEWMKEYMNDCYKLRLKKNYRSPMELIECEPEEPTALFHLMRAVVIGIFIFLCAIAVTTLNNYDKMDEFTDTAAEMNQSLEEMDE